MTKYFKNVTSLEDLKNQFKALARKNHPDAGGNAETMKEINCEYDALFPIWKDRYNTAEPQNQTTETADSTRSQFYTECGWEGKNHDWNRSLKEVAQIVRAYVKEKYPTYKFSVRTSYASMCQELHVALKEAPADIYKKSPSELTEDERTDMLRSLRYNNLFHKDSWYDWELDEAIQAAWNKSDCYKIYNEVTAKIIDDVNCFVNSYNFSDCDGQIDFFHVDFYYFGCKPVDLKIVPKTARIKKQRTAPQKTKKAAQATPETPQEITEKSAYTYKITKGEDTRDGSELWLVRINETLDCVAYAAENKAMQERGGYYSKFRKAFIFRFDPSEILTGKKVA